MNRLLCFILSLAFISAAHAASPSTTAVTVAWQEFTADYLRLTNRITQITPTGIRADGTRITIGEMVKRTNDSEAKFTVMMVPGQYKLEVVGPVKIGELYITVPESPEAAYDASTLITSKTNLSSGDVAYSASASDNRFVRADSSHVFSGYHSNVLASNLVAGPGVTLSIVQGNKVQITGGSSTNSTTGTNIVLFNPTNNNLFGTMLYKELPTYSGMDGGSNTFFIDAMALKDLYFYDPDSLKLRGQIACMNNGVFVLLDEDGWTTCNPELWFGYYPLLSNTPMLSPGFVWDADVSDGKLKLFENTKTGYFGLEVGDMVVATNLWVSNGATIFSVFDVHVNTNVSTNTYLLRVFNIADEETFTISTNGRVRITGIVDFMNHVTNQGKVTFLSDEGVSIYGPIVSYNGWTNLGVGDVRNDGGDIIAGVGHFFEGDGSHLTGVSGSGSIVNGENLGTGTNAWFVGTNAGKLRFNSVDVAGGLVIHSNNNVLVISNAAGSGTGSIVNGENLGGGTNALFVDTNSSKLRFNTIDTAGGLVIHSNNNRLVLSNSVVAAANPAGNSTEVQFNNGGAFGSDSDFIYYQPVDLLSVNAIRLPVANDRVMVSGALLGYDGVLQASAVTLTELNMLSGKTSLQPGDSDLTDYAGWPTNHIITNLNSREFHTVYLTTWGGLNPDKYSSWWNVISTNYPVYQRGRATNLTLIDGTNSGTLTLNGTGGTAGSFDLYETDGESYTRITANDTLNGVNTVTLPTNTGPLLVASEITNVANAAAAAAAATKQDADPDLNDWAAIGVASKQDHTGALDVWTTRATNGFLYATDTPTEGQVPTAHLSGTNVSVTWDTPSASGGGVGYDIAVTNWLTANNSVVGIWTQTVSAPKSIFADVSVTMGGPTNHAAYKLMAHTYRNATNGAILYSNLYVYGYESAAGLDAYFNTNASGNLVLYVQGTTSESNYWTAHGFVTACDVPSGNPEVGSLTISNATLAVNESNGTALVHIQRTGGSVGTVSVDVRTSNGTAVVTSDYTATNATFTWTDGQTDTKPFAVAIVNDTNSESSEAFSIVLSNIVTASYGANVANTVTITDDDVAPWSPPANSLALYTSNALWMWYAAETLWGNTNGYSVTQLTNIAASDGLPVVSSTGIGQYPIYTTGVFATNYPALWHDGSAGLTNNGFVNASGFHNLTFFFALWASNSIYTNATFEGDYLFSAAPASGAWSINHIMDVNYGTNAFSGIYEGGIRTNASSVAQAGPLVYTVILQKDATTTTNWTMRRNGSEILSTNTVIAYPEITNRFGIFCKYSDLADDDLTGYAAEILIYTNALSLQNITNTEEYLRAKYQLY